MGTESRWSRSCVRHEVGPPVRTGFVELAQSKLRGVYAVLVPLPEPHMVAWERSVSKAPRVGGPSGVGGLRRCQPSPLDHHGKSRSGNC